MRQRSLSDIARARKEEEAHALQTKVTWRNISIFLAIPACGLVGYNAYIREKAHMEHGRAEFVAYSHLRIRNKPFPWGDGNHTLVHNPHTNALPDGYEDEE